MKKIITAVVAAAAVVAPIAVTAAPAEAAGSPGCVTKREWRQVKTDMSIGKVAQTFGTRGHVEYSSLSSDGSGRMRVNYPKCSGRWPVRIFYLNYTFTSPWHLTPMRVVTKYAW